MSKTKFLKTLEQCPTTYIKHVKKIMRIFVMESLNTI